MNLGIEFDLTTLIFIGFGSAFFVWAISKIFIIIFEIFSSKSGRAKF